MDNFEYTYTSAHPNAQALMKEDFYFSPIEETGPFGSDDGWEAAYGFRDWRVSKKKASPVDFLIELIEEWQYPFFDYNELDASKIEAYINQGFLISEADILQQIQTLNDINKNNDEASGIILDEKQLRELFLSSSTGMNGIYLLGQDNAIIGIGFAQLVLEGGMDSDIQQLVKTAITRQLLPVLINRYEPAFRAKRKQQLEKMLEVVNKVNS
ncbi:MAG: hypothetical protein NTW29_20665 [Bacteroidetes bacterium]|nr:hypothetical protein [Bacteroidota bacterium]